MKSLCGASRPLLTVLVLGGCPTLLIAQANQCAAGPSSSVVTETGEAARFPVDRIADILALEPGVTSLNQGDLSVWGAGQDAVGNYIDGVPVTPANRGRSALLGGSYLGERGTGLAIGTNGFDRLFLFKGIAPAELSGRRGGALAVSTDGSCTPRPVLSGGLASDALFGNSNGLGFNRVTLNGNGQFGRFSLGGAAILEGAQSERLGLDQNGSPIFMSAGIDTTVTFDQGGTPTTADVLKFVPTDGIRIPRTANSAYTLNAHAGYQLGGGHTVTLSGFASQDQRRLFDYQKFYNPVETAGERSWSRMLTGSWTGPLKRSERLSLRGEAMLSWQTDRATGGPLTPSGEQDTRDPFGGFLVSPLDFRFTTDNFAVNDELIRNVRTNSGRLSPYDLQNPDQYQPIDVYRNNAYGVNGFTEQGGPVGLLTLSQENRLVAKGVVDATVAQRHRLRFGAEFTRYDIDFYQMQLTSQAFNNVYLESPKSQAVFADYALTAGNALINAGVRYDRFKSGASRPDFPRISTMPGFDPAHPTALFDADKAHSRVSPSLSLGYRATPMLRLNAGIGMSAQQPDFAQVFQGINTDLQTTNASQVYGTDLDYEHATLIQFGAELVPKSDLAVVANLWRRKDQDLVAVRIVDELDPARNTNFPVSRLQNVVDRTTTGFDVGAKYQLGHSGLAWLSYTFTDASLRVAGGNTLFGPNKPLEVNDARPHSVTAGVRYETGATPSIAVLRNLGFYATARIASGTGFTRCAAVPGNAAALSDDATICPGGFSSEINEDRLPALKLVDLRISRGFPIGHTELVAFVDARNLLNSRNVVRVFGQTGGTSNSSDRAQNQNFDLNEFASEADDNGVRQLDGTINLSFGGITDPRAGCGAWTRGGQGAVPNCIYLINAERRFGDGDHLFTLAEQTRASNALYDVSRGLQNFTGPGRRVRIGLELRL